MPMKPQGERQRSLSAKSKSCRKTKDAKRKGKNEARRRAWKTSREDVVTRKGRYKNSVNQRAGDVTEVLHLFDQDRESAVQRAKDLKRTENQESIDHSNS